MSNAKRVIKTRTEPLQLSASPVLIDVRVTADAHNWVAQAVLADRSPRFHLVGRHRVLLFIFYLAVVRPLGRLHYPYDVFHMRYDHSRNDQQPNGSLETSTKF